MLGPIGVPQPAQQRAQHGAPLRRTAPRRWVRAHRDSAKILMLPTVDAVAVSPADFSRILELIELGYRSSRRLLSAATRPPAIKPAAVKLVGLPRVAAPAA